MSCTKLNLFYIFLSDGFFEFTNLGRQLRHESINHLAYCGILTQATEQRLFIQAKALESKVIEVLRTCYDPEIPVDIYELGLIYEVKTNSEGKVHIRMTLTSPACPVAGSLPPEIEAKVRAMEDVHEAKVEVIWDPPWTPEKMSEAARLQLNI